MKQFKTLRDFQMELCRVTDGGYEGTDLDIALGLIGKAGIIAEVHTEQYCGNSMDPRKDKREALGVFLSYLADITMLRRLDDVRMETMPLDKKELGKTYEHLKDQPASELIFLLINSANIFANRRLPKQEYSAMIWFITCLVARICEHNGDTLQDTLVGVIRQYGRIGDDGSESDEASPEENAAWFGDSDCDVDTSMDVGN